MFGVTLRAEDIQGLIHDLRREKYLLAADALADTSRLFLRKLDRPHNPRQRFSEYARLLVAPNRALTVVRKQVNPLLSISTRRRLDKLATTVALFSEGRSDMVFYLAEDTRDTVMLCATVADLTAQFHSTLWNQPRPIILTSGTLAVGSDFHRFREEEGLLADSRVMESVLLSPFEYRENCLLYVPRFPPGQRDKAYGDCVSLLVIPRLPFARPDALKEKEREAFPNLHSFIQAIVVPEMQIKLKQGFGRAIRTETDTCVIAILDERSVPGQRYFEDVKTALPDMRITDSFQDVEAFIRSVKGEDYFQEGGR